MNYKSLYDKLCVPSDNWRNPPKGLYKHRIIPRHAGGKYKNGNVVLLTYRQHVLAHLILSRLGSKNDKLAYLAMKNQTEKYYLEVRRMGGQAAVKSGQLDSLRTTEHQIKAGRLGGQKIADSGGLLKICRQGGKAGGASNVRSGHIKLLGVTWGRVNGKVTMSQKYKCLECGLVSTPPSVGRHQKFSKHIGKEKIK